MKRLVLCLFIGLMTVATSCKKDETSNQNNTTTEKPIAVYDNNTGVMTYNFDIDMLNLRINKQLAKREMQEHYIIEDVKILDRAPSSPDIKPEIKITLLDTEKETSHTFWLMEFFTYKKVSLNEIEYYLDREVKNGVYEMATMHNGFIYILYINGDKYTVEKIKDSKFTSESDYLTMAARWFIDCIAVNCSENECNKGGKFFNAYCEPCKSQGSTCTRQPASWIEPTITGAVGIIIALIPFLL